MITAVPADIPETIPEREPTSAIAILLLDQAPAPEAVSAAVLPAHTDEDPEITEGEGLTVTVTVVKQPPGKVYVITEVPIETPVTTPVDEPTEAIAGTLLDQVPPPASTRVVVAPTHTEVAPDMGAAAGFTVTVVLPVAVQVIISVTVSV